MAGQRQSIEVENVAFHTKPLVSRYAIFEPGQILMKKGEEPDNIYMVVEGEVEIIGDDGSVITVQGKGEFVGEIAFLNESTRTATVRAKTIVRALEMGADDFFETLSQKPKLATRLLRDLGRRVADLTKERDNLKRGIGELQERLMVKRGYK